MDCIVPGNIHTHAWRAIGIFKGEEVSKAKIFKGQYKPKLDFQEGWGEAIFKQKSNLWEENRHFLEQYIFHFY